MAQQVHVRTQVLIAVGFILIAILIGRLADLQLVRHDHFSDVAEAQRKRAADLIPHRGTIYVHEGKGADIFPVASNKKAWSAYAVPRNMKDPKSVADTLAPELVKFQERQQQRVDDTIQQTGQNDILALQSPSPTPNPGESSPSPSATPEPEDQKITDMAASLYAKFNQKTDPYEPILKPYETLDDDFLQFLQKSNLPGVVLNEEEVRTYPEGSLLAHVLGYVGFDGSNRVGRYGIEGFFDGMLKGDLGFLSGERAATGGLIGVAANQFKAAQDGSDITLTIDRVVQAFAEDELKQGVQKYKADRGSILVMNPKTGQVLAMATFPTFDPNMYYAVRDSRVQTNPIVSDSFEPGSILKPVIMSGAINDSLVTPDTTFVDSGPVHIGKYTINTFDGKHHGVQTMTNILEQSNNVGMVWVAEKMGAQRMYDYLRRFGIGERTGIELDGETQTNIKEPQKWGETNQATIGFGQGIVVTPIQALNAIDAIADGGVLRQPHIIDSVQATDGRTTATSPTTVRQVITEDTANKISAMMVSVIENGVGRSARVPGYYLAGKTGTAQVADDTGKYSTTNKIITFAGFGPVPDPQFSILIKLDNPYGLSFASGTAAPMFHDLASKLLTYYQVPPSYDASLPQQKFEVPN